jgi:hypothetical protein
VGEGKFAVLDLSNARTSLLRSLCIPPVGGLRPPKVLKNMI